MTKYFDIDIESLESAIDHAMDRTAAHLRTNHIWNNITGNAERSIHTEKEGEDSVLVVGVPYASHVNYWKGFMTELEHAAEANVLADLEAYLSHRE